MNKINKDTIISVISLSSIEKDEINNLILDCYFLKKEIIEDYNKTMKEIKFLQCSGVNCSEFKEEMKKFKFDTDDMCYLLDCLISVYQEILE